MTEDERKRRVREAIVRVAVDHADLLRRLAEHDSKEIFPVAAQTESRVCFCGAPAFRDSRECEQHYREALARRGIVLLPRMPDPETPR